MGQVISSHPAWSKERKTPIRRGILKWPPTCIERMARETGVAYFTRELTEEYWRPAPGPGSSFSAGGFQVHRNEAFCTVCGTQYAPGARFCHLCGLDREDDLRTSRRMMPLDLLDFETIRERTGLPGISLVLLLAAAMSLLAAVMSGLVYNTATIAEWQAVQVWRIEWLLAAVVALLAAILLKKK